MANPRIVAKIESEEPTHRLAVLIDADNAQAAIIETIRRNSQCSRGYSKKDLWRLYVANKFSMEKSIKQTCYQTCSTVCVHNGQKHDG